MALLVGQETEEATELSVPKGLAVAYKFTAAKTGKVTALHVKTNGGTATSANIALQADSAETPKVGAALAEGSLGSVATGEHEVSVTEVEVKEGTVYWLTIQPQGGTVKVKGGTTAKRKKTTVERATIAAIENIDWGSGTNNGPMAIWGTGTLPVQEIAGICKLTLGTKALGAPVQSGLAITTLSLKDTAASSMSSAAVAVSKIPLAAQALGSQIQSDSAKTAMILKNTAASGMSSTAVGATKLRLADQALSTTAAGPVAHAAVTLAHTTQIAQKTTAIAATKVQFITAVQVEGSTVARIVGVTAFRFRVAHEPEAFQKIKKLNPENVNFRLTTHSLSLGRTLGPSGTATVRFGQKLQTGTRATVTAVTAVTLPTHAQVSAIQQASASGRTSVQFVVRANAEKLLVIRLPGVVNPREQAGRVNPRAVGTGLFPGEGVITGGPFPNDGGLSGGGNVVPP